MVHGSGFSAVNSPGHESAYLCSFAPDTWRGNDCSPEEPPTGHRGQGEPGRCRSQDRPGHGKLLPPGKYRRRLEQRPLLPHSAGKHQADGGYFRGALPEADHLVLAEKNAGRFRTLAEKNLVSKQEAEQDDTVCTVAREEVTRCRAAIESARMEQRGSRAGLGLARSKVADTLIYAPQDGSIISRDLEKGAMVTTRPRFPRTRRGRFTFSPYSMSLPATVRGRLAMARLKIILKNI
jgi:hypothetical protein